MSDKYSVEIPEDIYKKIEGRIGEAGFDSVEDYIGYVLREVLASLEEDEEQEEEQVFSEEEEEKVKERLRALGYID